MLRKYTPNQYQRVIVTRSIHVTLRVYLDNIKVTVPMPITLNGQTYFRTAEVYRMIGISRNTLYRWLKSDLLNGTEHRDWRGWRLFTKDEVDRLKAEITRVTTINRLG